MRCMSFRHPPRTREKAELKLKSRSIRGPPATRWLKANLNPGLCAMAAPLPPMAQNALHSPDKLPLGQSRTRVGQAGAKFKVLKLQFYSSRVGTCMSL